MAKKDKDFGIEKSLKKLGIKSENKGVSSGGKYFASGDLLESHSPTDGKLIAKVKTANSKDYDKVIETAKSAFKEFRMIPSPKRGELVRQFGNKLREKKDDLGKLVSYEMGKSLQLQFAIIECSFLSSKRPNAHSPVYRGQAGYQNAGSPSSRGYRRQNARRRQGQRTRTAPSDG